MKAGLGPAVALCGYQLPGLLDLLARQFGALVWKAPGSRDRRVKNKSWH